MPSRILCPLLLIPALWAGIASAQTPMISSLNPSGTGSGGPDFTLTISGSNLDGGVVYWNGSPLITTLSGSNLLSATVPAALIAAPGTASVDVANAGGGLSNFVVFTIYPQPLSITTTSLSAGTVSNRLLISTA